MIRYTALLLAGLLLAAPIALPASAAAEYRRPSDELVLLAAESGMLDLLHQRLDGGAYIDSTDYRGRTPLMLAARGGHLEVVEALLRRGAEVERVDAENYSAAQYALRRGHVTILHLILGWCHGTEAYRRQITRALIVARRVGDPLTERRLKELYQAADAEPLRPAIAEGRWPRQDAISTDPIVRWLPFSGYRGGESPPPPNFGFQPAAVVPPPGSVAAPASLAAPVPRPAASLPPMINPGGGWPYQNVPGVGTGPLSDLPPIPPPPAELLPLQTPPPR